LTFATGAVSTVRLACPADAAAFRPQSARSAGIASIGVMSALAELTPAAAVIDLTRMMPGVAAYGRQFRQKRT